MAMEYQIGSCPRCGSPIYAESNATMRTNPPLFSRTCQCPLDVFQENERLRLNGLETSNEQTLLVGYSSTSFAAINNDARRVEASVGRQGDDASKLAADTGGLTQMSEHPADTALRAWVVGDDWPVAPKEVAAFRAGWSAAAAEIEDLRDQLDRTTQTVCILGPQRDEARLAAREMYLDVVQYDPCVHCPGWKKQWPWLIEEDK